MAGAVVTSSVGSGASAVATPGVGSGASAVVTPGVGSGAQRRCNAWWGVGGRPRFGSSGGETWLPSPASQPCHPHQQECKPVHVPVARLVKVCRSLCSISGRACSCVCWPAGQVCRSLCRSLGAFTHVAVGQPGQGVSKLVLNIWAHLKGWSNASIEVEKLPARSGHCGSQPRSTPCSGRLRRRECV